MIIPSNSQDPYETIILKSKQPNSMYISDNFFSSSESLLKLPYFASFLMKVSQFQFVPHPPLFFHQSRSLFSWLDLTSSIK